MTYFYNVFGLTCSSSIKLPAFVEVSPTNIDFKISLGKVSKKLFTKLLFVNEDSISYNKTEFFLFIKDTGRYFVRNGNEIILDPLCNDINKFLLFFYSNCIASLLYQKNMVPFHVSGVFDTDGKVWLFGALSGTGKSTTSVKLKELGYKIFTDDTARIYVQDNKCYAIASYPMTRLWEKSLQTQKGYDIKKAKLISDEHQKYGLLFHEDFVSSPVEVKGIIFLEKTESDDITIKNIPTKEGLKLLIENIYRPNFANGMQKQLLVHSTVTKILSTVPFYKAQRPENKDTFNEFAAAIQKNIFYQ